MGEIRITVSGAVGSGKSAVLAELEIALRAIGVPVRYENLAKEREDKNGSDLVGELEMYKPSAVLVEETLSGPMLAITEASIRFLELDSDELDARIEANKCPESDELYCKYHMLSEQRETARRVLGDAIIRQDEKHRKRVRRVVWFSISDAATGSVIQS